MKIYNKILIYLIITLTVFTTQTPLTSQAQSSTLNNGLISHYTFDDANNLGKDNTGTNNGTTVGVPTSVTGKVGSGAISLDGINDRLIVSSPTNLTFNTTFTLSTWIKTSTSSTDRKQILGRWDGIEYGYMLAMNETASKDHKIRILIDKDVGGGSIDAARASVNPINDNIWHHVVGVYDGPNSRLDLYVDGVLSSAGLEGTVPPSISNQSRPFYIGNDNGNTRLFSGNVDEVRVYNRALATSEVSELYNLGSGIVSEPSIPNTPTNPVSTVPPAPSGTTEWFVSSSGTSNGNGSIISPWDLQTALNNPNKYIKAGHTIWLRGGVYTGNFNSNLLGSYGNNILINPYNNERVVIQGRILHKDGGYVTYKNFEITDSYNIKAKRVSNQSGSFPNDISTGAGVSILASPGIKIINLVIHDVVGPGIYVNKQSTGVELYGNIIYHNGWDGTDRKHGHNLYLQNIEPTMLIKNNIIFSAFENGIQAYGSESPALNIDFEDNILFNNDFLIGAVTPVSGMKIINNIFGERNNARFYYNNKFNQDILIQNNYFVELFQAFWWNKIDMKNNFFYKGIELRSQESGDITKYSINNNKYYNPPIIMTVPPAYAYTSFCKQYSLECIFTAWKSLGFDPNGAYYNTLPSTPIINIKNNKYNQNLAYVSIINPSGQNSVLLDASSIFSTGDKYEIFDVQNYFGNPIVKGIYNGGNINIPMNLTIIDEYRGDMSNPNHNDIIEKHTSSKFGVYVIVKDKTSSTESSYISQPSIPSITTNIPSPITSNGANNVNINYDGVSGGGGGGGGSRSGGGGGSTPITTTTPVPTTNNNFTRTISITSTGNDVKQLQTILNNLGYTVTTTGPGSKGYESLYFGPATRLALIRFQTSKSIPSTGILDTQTISLLNSLSTNTIPTTTTPTSTYTFTRSLTIGSKGEDVRQLQILLNSKGYIVTATGPGSKGLETTTFGPATRSALIRYQIANNITPSLGYFGPITREKVR